MHPLDGSKHTRGIDSVNYFLKYFYVSKNEHFEMLEKIVIVDNEINVVHMLEEWED